MTEAMAPALAPDGIGVSVLCPGMVVADPDTFTNFRLPSAEWYARNLMSAEPVADEVLHGIREGRLHIFPHRAGRGEVEERHELLLAAFEQAARTSPPLR